MTVLTDTTTPTTRLPVFLLICLVIGLIIGGLTLLLQSLLPSSVIQIANSGAVWSVVAFIIGRRTSSRSRAMLGGLIALIGEVLGYYTVSYFANLMDIMPSTLAVVGYWLVIALVAGPVFGWAGYVSVHRDRLVQRVGMAAMAAAFIGEGLYLLTILSTPNTTILWIIIAIVITLMLTWRRPDRLQIWGITLLLGLLFFAAEQALVLLDQLRTELFQG
jgi:hypothetical protein